MFKLKNLKSKSKGFTLIELLIVIIIIGILAAAILPGLLSNRKTASATRLISDTNSISKEFLNFVVSEIPVDRGFTDGGDAVYKSNGEVVFRNDDTSVVNSNITQDSQLDGTNKLSELLVKDYGINKSYVRAGKFQYIAKTGATADTDALNALVSTPANLAPETVSLVSYEKDTGEFKSFLVYCGPKGFQEHGSLINGASKGATKAVMDKLIEDTAHKGSCFPVDLSK